MRILLSAMALLFAVPVAADPAMWVVRGAGSEITLFGTIHELPRSAGWQTPRILDRFDAAGSLVVEADVPADPYVLGAAVSRAGIVPGLPPLLQRLPADQRPRLLAAAVRAKLAMAALDNMKTWLAAITLSDAVVDQLGFSADAGVDTTLLSRAREQAKPIVPLETMAQQLGFFDALSEADQQALLIAVLDDLDSTKADLDRLVAAWQAGDLAAIALDTDKELKATPKLAKLLLADRNARWAEWLAGVAKRPGKVFVAVGAGHLAGPGSVVELLEQRGLTVERIR